MPFYIVGKTELIIPMVKLSRRFIFDLVMRTASERNSKNFQLQQHFLMDAL